MRTSSIIKRILKIITETTSKLKNKRPCTLYHVIEKLNEIVRLNNQLVDIVQNLGNQQLTKAQEDFKKIGPFEVQLINAIKETHKVDVTLFNTDNLRKLKKLSEKEQVETPVGESMRRQRYRSATIASEPDQDNDQTVSGEDINLDSESSSDELDTQQFQTPKATGESTGAIPKQRPGQEMLRETIRTNPHPGTPSTMDPKGRFGAAKAIIGQNLVPRAPQNEMAPIPPPPPKQKPAFSMEEELAQQRAREQPGNAHAQPRAESHSQPLSPEQYTEETLEQKLRRLHQKVSDMDFAIFNQSEKEKQLLDVNESLNRKCEELADELNRQLERNKCMDMRLKDLEDGYDAEIRILKTKLKEAENNKKPIQNNENPRNKENQNHTPWEASIWTNPYRPSHRPPFEPRQGPPYEHNPQYNPQSNPQHGSGYERQFYNTNDAQKSVKEFNAEGTSVEDDLVTFGESSELYASGLQPGEETKYVRFLMARMITGKAKRLIGNNKSIEKVADLYKLLKSLCETKETLPSIVAKITSCQRNDRQMKTFMEELLVLKRKAVEIALQDGETNAVSADKQYSALILSQLMKNAGQDYRGLVYTQPKTWDQAMEYVNNVVLIPEETTLWQDANSYRPNKSDRKQFSGSTSDAEIGKLYNEMEKLKKELSELRRAQASKVQFRQATPYSSRSPSRERRTSGQAFNTRRSNSTERNNNSFRSHDSRSNERSDRDHSENRNNFRGREPQRNSSRERNGQRTYSNDRGNSSNNSDRRNTQPVQYTTYEHEKNGENPFQFLMEGGNNQ